MKRILFIFFAAFLFCLVGYSIFLPLYSSSHIMIDYGINPFDICVEQPILWQYCKYWFVFTYVFASFFISNFLFHLLSKIPFPFFKASSKPKSMIFKKESPYSFISPPVPTKPLELLIR